MDITGKSFMSRSSLDALVQEFRAVADAPSDSVRLVGPERSKQYQLLFTGKYVDTRCQAALDSRRDANGKWKDCAVDGNTVFISPDQTTKDWKMRTTLLDLVHILRNSYPQFKNDAEIKRKEGVVTVQGCPAFLVECIPPEVTPVIKCVKATCRTAKIDAFAVAESMRSLPPRKSYAEQAAWSAASAFQA